MNHTQHRLLVPVDFSEIAVNAVNYALELAPTFQCGITLLHIVDDAEYKPKGEAKMAEFVAQFSTEVPIKTFVLPGNLFEDIAKAAELLEVYMVVLGTPELSGFEYLFGSNALRIVTSASAPFLITQAQAPQASFDNIVVPIDLSADDRQILSLVIQASRLFRSKIHLFVAHHSDEFQRNNTYRNEQFAHRYLDEHDVHYTTIHAEGKNSFDKELLEYADLISANMIALVNHKEVGFLNMLGKNFDQNIITNPMGIPVMIMNASELKKITDIFDVFV